jgi:hypothetical protein
MAKGAGSACARWQKNCYRHEDGFCSLYVLDYRARGEWHVGQLDTRHDCMAFEQGFPGSDTLLELSYDTVRSILFISALTDPAKLSPISSFCFGRCYIITTLP